MKIIAYTALHYGIDYLGASIRSIIDNVDEYHVLYSAQGSHGHRTNVPCPDRRDELFSIARWWAKGKLVWHDGDWQYENEQRNAIYDFAPDADVILVLDADEVWGPGLAAYAIEAAQAQPVRNWRVPIVHYWRSFHRAILHDPAYPERIIVPANESGESYVYRGGVINHLGYAQRSTIVEYKMLIHGHKNEFRRDVDWTNEVFLNPARTTDLHPVGSDAWTPEPVNPLDYMPPWMATHPYFNMERIP